MIVLEPSTKPETDAQAVLNNRGRYYPAINGVILRTPQYQKLVYATEAAAVAVALAVIRDWNAEAMKHYHAANAALHAKDNTSFTGPPEEWAAADELHASFMRAWANAADQRPETLCKWMKDHDADNPAVLAWSEAHKV